MSDNSTAQHSRPTPQSEIHCHPLSPALRLPSLPLFTNILAISERFDVLTAKFRVKRMPVREKRKRKEGQSTKLRK